MTSKKPTLLIRIDKGTKDALRNAATDDARSMASMVEKYAVECLRRDGYLPMPKRSKKSG